jgi:glyoxylase-like metal-dependent hydrolase (beta-lactamase superfamily II)
VRTGHATTALVRSAGSNILINPSLPAAAVIARLDERSGLKPEQITHLFFTSWSRDNRRALNSSTFEHVPWILNEPERDAALANLNEQIGTAEEGDEPDLLKLLEFERQLLLRTVVAEQTLAPGVDIFPLPGVTPGTCGLLLALPIATVLICGDAVATVEHLEQGKVLPNSMDVEQAQESFREALEIADAMILGRDNIVYNPLRSRM